MSNRPKQLADIAKAAVTVERETQVPAEAIVSQWAVETGWGDSPAGNNYFGIKRADRHTMYTLKWTPETWTQAQLDEWNREHPDRPARILGRSADGHLHVEILAEFADYPDLISSVRDYAWLVSHGAPYAAGWKQYRQDHNLDGLIAAIAKAGYATGENYRQLVTGIAHQGNVRTALEAARASHV